VAGAALETQRVRRTVTHDVQRFHRACVLRHASLASGRRSCQTSGTRTEG
jgi:hypothetical protein